jgi:chromosome segregation ATPase
MRRDFLKNLGIDDSEVISKILDENSADIGRAKGELETYKNKVTDLEHKVTDKDNEIATLNGKIGDVDALNEQIKQLEADKTNLTNELNTKVAGIQKTHAIENKIRDEKGKNVKAIMALLDHNKITFEDNTLTGLDEQLAQLKEASDSAMLFGEMATPSGTTPSNPINNGGTPTPVTLNSAIANALKK